LRVVAVVGAGQPFAVFEEWEARMFRSPRPLYLLRSSGILVV
jgi:hypothetical protein